MLSAKPGHRLAPQRVLSASSKVGASEIAFIVVAGRQLRVEVFVATSRGADEAIAQPNLDPGPLDGVKMDGDH